MRRANRLSYLIIALVIGFVSGCEDAAIPMSTPLPDQGAVDQSVLLPDFQRPDPDAESDMAMDADQGVDDNSCTDGSECVSGYCVPGPDGQRVCADLCRNDENCPEGFECRPVANSRPDTVFICVAIRRVQCLPCNHDGDCGSGQDRCIEIGSSLRCARDCSTEDCPDGSSCTEVDVEGETQSLCMPDDETCEPCVDPDGDGYGNEGDCLGLDCDEDDPLSHEGATEICDGRDNDCDTVPDNDVPRVSAPLDLICMDQGVCSGTQPSCGDGQWGCSYPDTYQPDAEISCDGLDNDCDGSIDESIETPPANLVVGVCVGASKLCAGDAGFVEPDYGLIAGYEVEEATCDGLDNDCDNSTDEGIELPAADLQVGVCVGALKTCGGEAGFTEPDYGQFVGYENVEATCDGLDNDCDGQADETLQPPLGLNQNGVCSGQVQVCDGANGFVEPDYTQLADYEGIEARCDGLDNDCNGLVDDGVMLAPADRQLGVCIGAIKVCAGPAGIQEPDYTSIPGYELNESACDGLDNDCDGQTDEAIQPPLAQIQAGVCSGSVQVCNAADGFGEPEYALIPDHEADEVTCDGLDNDCDAAIDEEIERPFGDLTLGVCAGSRKVCSGQAGLVEPNYADIETYEIEEVTCDGLDNDCDGNVDEGVIPPLADNQNGICEGARKVCSGLDGIVEPDYSQLPRFSENDTPTDMLDTNCDGVVGELGRIVFVSPFGNDNNSGLVPQVPLRSIEAALQTFDDDDGRYIVAVATGNYQAIRSLEIPSGVHVYGGYGDNFQTRSTVRSAWATTSSVGLRVSRATAPTTVDGLAISVESRNIPGEEAVGIVVDRSDENFSANNVTVTVGNGGNGLNGTAGVNGASGGNGGNGAGSGGAGRQWAAAVPVAMADAAHQVSAVRLVVPMTASGAAEAPAAIEGLDAMMAIHPPEAMAKPVFGEPLAQTGKSHRMKVALKV